MESQPIDLRQATDWTAVLRVECADCSWGQLILSAEARSQIPTGGKLSSDVETWPWVEVRVIATTAGISSIWFEGAAGNHDAESASIGGGEGNSPGPIILPFGLGEVPDYLEVLARARSGGGVTDGLAEYLTIMAASRFRR
jgi:hypothetical protein